MALTLREYTVSFFLAGFVLTAFLAFTFTSAGSLNEKYGMNVEAGALSNIESDIKSNQASQAELSNTTRKVSVEQTAGFISGLKSALEIVTNSLNTLTALPSIAESATRSLGLPPFISNLVYIPFVAVAYEVVSFLTGLRT